MVGHKQSIEQAWRCGRTAALIKSGKLPDVSVRDAQKNYKKALEKGILKILSKMGISLLSCYHGAQIFEVRPALEKPLRRACNRM